MSTESYRLTDVKEDFAFGFVVYAMVTPIVTIGTSFLLALIAGIGYEFLPLAIWPHIIDGVGQMVLASTFVHLNELMMGGVAIPAAYVLYRFVEKQVGY